MYLYDLLRSRAENWRAGQVVFALMAGDVQNWEDVPADSGGASEDDQGLELAVISKDETEAALVGSEDASDAPEWQPFEFAVGRRPRPNDCSACSRLCCPITCCPRVGNMIVVRESRDEQGKWYSISLNGAQ